MEWKSMHLLCVCMSACVCVGGYTWMAPQMAATVLCSSVCVLFLLVFPVYLFTFTFMHLADAFIQSDLQCIQAIHLYCQYVFPGNRTHNLCAANTML